MNMTMAQALNQALSQEMERDERVLILGEDVGVNGGVFRVTEGLVQKFGSQRVMDTPLAESGIIGVSIGLAALGLRPVPEIQFLGFIYPGFNQIISHLARLRNRTRGRFPMPVVIRTPYGAGMRALEHHDESSEALFCQIPGLTVVAPSTPREAKGLLAASIRSEDPVLFLEPAKLYRSEKEDVPDEPYETPLRRARLVQEGGDVTLIAWGAMIPVVTRAAGLAADQGVSAEIIDLRTLSPFDAEAVLQSVGKTGRAVIVHEAPRTCGLGAELAAVIGESALLSLKAPVLRVTGWDVTVPLSKSEDYFFVSPERVLRAITRVMEF
jgi:pyruvate dehydrogenase E1 component beta subunit